jgi:hypothetical protein
LCGSNDETDIGGRMAEELPFGGIEIVSVEHVPESERAL